MRARKSIFFGFSSAPVSKWSNKFFVWGDRWLYFQDPLDKVYMYPELLSVGRSDNPSLSKGPRRGGGEARAYGAT